jgi:hypothetical protein
MRVALLLALGILPASAVYASLGGPLPGAPDASPARTTGAAVGGNGTGVSTLEVVLRDVPMDGGFAQAAVHISGPALVNFTFAEKWSAAAEGPQAGGEVLAFAGRGFGAGLAGDAAPILAAHVGTKGFSCCDERAFSKLDLGLAGLAPVASDGHGRGSLDANGSSVLVLTAYGTSWAPGSYVNLTLVASAPVLGVTYATPVAGGIHAYDPFVTGHVNGTFVAAGPWAAGEFRSTRSTWTVTRGAFAQVFLQERDANLSLAWSVPSVGGPRTGSTLYGDHVFLQAGEPFAGNVSLSAEAKPESLAAGLFGANGPLRSPSGLAIVGDFNPGGSWLFAFPTAPPHDGRAP